MKSRQTVTSDASPLHQGQAHFSLSLASWLPRIHRVRSIFVPHTPSSTKSAVPPVWLGNHLNIARTLWLIWLWTMSYGEAVMFLLCMLQDSSRWTSPLYIPTRVVRLRGRHVHHHVGRHYHTAICYHYLCVVGCKEERRTIADREIEWQRRPFPFYSNTLLNLV